MSGYSSAYCINSSTAMCDVCFAYSGTSELKPLHKVSSLGIQALQHQDEHAMCTEYGACAAAAMYASTNHTLLPSNITAIQQLCTIIHYDIFNCLQ
eukprot:6175-Heterococcus_DN1.PRE.5